MLLAACPGREAQVAALTGAGGGADGDRTVAACRQRGGDAAWRASDSCRERGGCKGEFQDLRHAGVVVCCPHVLPMPRALQSMEKAFVPCPDQTAQLFITMKYGGISKANCK